MGEHKKRSYIDLKVYISLYKIAYLYTASVREDRECLLRSLSDSTLTAQTALATKLPVKEGMPPARTDEAQRRPLTTSLNALASYGAAQIRPKWTARADG